MRYTDLQILKEKAESENQAIAARIALKHKKEGTRPKAGTASAEMVKMSKGDLEDFTKAKKGAPKKKTQAKESTQLIESTGTTKITIGDKTYEVGNDLVKQNGVYAIFSGNSARAYAEANGYVVPPKAVLEQVYAQGTQLEMPTRPNNPTDTDAEAHHEQILEQNGSIPSGLVYGHKKEICEGAGTRLFGGIVNGKKLQRGTSSQHGGGYVDYSQGLRVCKLIEGDEESTANKNQPQDKTAVYVIGDSHAKAMGGSNNLAQNGATIGQIESQARKVPDNATVYLSAGHNDVAAGKTSDQVATALIILIDMLTERGIDVKYVMFPEGTKNPNQENMGPTRSAIQSVTDVFYDLEGKGLSQDGQHAKMSTYRSILSSKGSAPKGLVTRSAEISEPEQEKNSKQLKIGPPYNPSDYDLVKDMQKKLIQLGYNVGRTGIDGKYGPRTARGVRAFKKDYNIKGDGRSVSQVFFDKLDKVVSGTIPKKDKPTNTGNPKPFSRKQVITYGMSDGDDYQTAKAIAEDFLGSEITDAEWEMLLRATVAEASPNAREQAGVMAVILNRARSNHGGWGGIEGQLNAKNQFQAVTGTQYDKGPSTWYKRAGPRQFAGVSKAVQDHLGKMDRSWLNFTSNVSAAYGRGTDIGFMYKMRNADNSKIIGKTVFGTA